MAVFLTVFLLMVRLLLVLSEDQTAKPGESVSLSCRSPDSRPVLVVEWSRTDLESGYVLLFRDDQIDPVYQNPSFKNRVDLQDRQMKDGDVSLFLKDVKTKDTGTYECRVVQRGTNRNKRAVLKSDLLSTVHLQVSPPGHQDVSSAGPSGLVAALVVLAVIVLMVPAVIIVIVRKRLPLYHPPPHDEAVELQPVQHV